MKVKWFRICVVGSHNNEENFFNTIGENSVTFEAEIYKTSE